MIPFSFQPKRSQFGRSMLEMLGVLAIIGLLSVAALAGFTYAMNKHKANETIHDVMLRASNVPMIDEFYTQRTGDYEWMFAGLPDSGQTGSFYTMNTWVSDINGYIYRVVVSDVPKRVCRQILALDPTDIDAIYVEGDKPTDDECPNEVNRMAFYFDEYGTGGHLPDIDKPDPDDPNPDNPDPDNPDPDQPECTPACGSCEECVNGSCQVKACEIESCPEGQTSTGTDACGCIMGCQEKCPGLTCEDCEVPNYDTCTCEADPDPCCGLEGAALTCCQGGLTCGNCELPNYNTCTCVADTSCSCEERGGETIPYLRGVCCEQPATCCSLDENCTAEACEITDETQCGVFCTDGAQTTSVCCTAVSMDGDEPENHVWVGDPYGDGYCCKSKNENQDCCKAADGKWCNNICCNTNQYCENGDCVSDSCTTAETSGSGSFCGGDYLTIARFTAQTSGKIKLIISRDPSQCGTNCHIFGLMDDWAQSTGLGCESSVTKTFSYSAGTHVIQVVVNGDCATGCTSFSYSLTCES